MQHSSIIRSLVRVALASDSPQLRHQVERLIESLRAEGEAAEASALVRLLNQKNRAVDVAPSRIVSSYAGTLNRKEKLTANTLLPVDKESATPLATVIQPADISADLPLFPEALRANIAALVAEWANRDLVVAAGLKPTLSCLVYGPPGTGKTTLALWFAKELGLPVVVARLDGLISSFLGTTARNLANLFTFANRYECVLVLDEFDALAKMRDDPNEVGEIKRVVNALLQNMDGRASQGFTIGLTNHEELLDPAIWRRFEVQLKVPLPALDQRLEIARRSFGGESIDGEAKLMAWLSEGLSGAELQTMVLKYRKRRVLSSGGDIPPIENILQLAQSTSVNVERVRVESLAVDEAPLLRELWRLPLGFTHSELAAIVGRSTKTISRRVSEFETEEGSIA